MSNEKRIPDWEEMGIEPDKLLTVEAMEWWLQHSPPQFIQAIVHEIRDKLMGMEFRATRIRDDPAAATIVLAASVKYHDTVKDDCEAILHYLNEMKAMLDIAWRYAEHLRSDDPVEE